MLFRFQHCFSYCFAASDDEAYFLINVVESRGGDLRSFFTPAFKDAVQVRFIVHELFVFFSYRRERVNNRLAYRHLEIAVSRPLKLFFDVGNALIRDCAINIDKIAVTSILCPPLPEQLHIATYLDKKCGEIDSLIELQEQMIENLKVYRQSVITEVVTKGLNPNAKLVPSGIDWIGEIPEGWEINKLFNLCTIKGRVGWKGLRSDEFKEDSYAYLVTGQDFVSSDINWKNCYQIDKDRYDEDPYIQLSNGDILVTKDGTIGKIAKVSGMDKPACLNSGIFVLKQRKEAFFQNYLYWYLSSPLLLQYNTFINSGGTTIIHLYQNVFERFSMIVPPMEEQIVIATYLDKKCADIDRLIALKQRKIEKLKDYKKSVIYEAVTGKTIIE